MIGVNLAIGKVEALKVLETGYRFHSIGNTDSDLGIIIKEATLHIVV